MVKILSKKKLFGIIAIMLIIAISAIGPIMSKVEQPKYTIIKKDNKIEIRQYEPKIVAEVTIAGNRNLAINQGFKILAGYIFGNNTIKDNIAMTTPVTQQQSETIAMTAPVTQQESAGKWKIAFTMPKQYTINTLPKPNATEITIKEVAPETFIAISFSGMNTDANLKKHYERLSCYMARNNITKNAAPIYAFYNPPWTLPFLRRNEILISIAAK